MIRQIEGMPAGTIGFEAVGEVGVRDGQLIAGGCLVAVRILVRPGDDARDIHEVAADGRGEVAVDVGRRDDLDAGVLLRGGLGGASRQDEGGGGDERDAGRAAARRTAAVDT